MDPSSRSADVPQAVPRDGDGSIAAETLSNHAEIEEKSPAQRRDGGEDDLEKPPFVFTTSSPKSNDGEEPIDDDDPRVRDIPPYVRRIVSLTDDPELPTLTFRYFVLTILFVVPGAFLSMLSHYRTTYAPYSIFFGVWLVTLF
jgi:hypothetical protein